jgi:hypothetical protein
LPGPCGCTRSGYCPPSPTSARSRDGCTTPSGSCRSSPRTGTSTPDCCSTTSRSPIRPRCSSPRPLRDPIAARQWRRAGRARRGPGSARRGAGARGVAAAVRTLGGLPRHAGALLARVRAAGARSPTTPAGSGCSSGGPKPPAISRSRQTARRLPRRPARPVREPADAAPTGPDRRRRLPEAAGPHPARATRGTARCGLSPASCTPSPHRCSTCSGPTSSTAPAKRARGDRDPAGHRSARTSPGDGDDLSSEQCRRRDGQVSKTCPSTTTVDEARTALLDDHVHALLVVEDGRLLAVVERVDLTFAAGNAPAGKRALGRPNRRPPRRTRHHPAVDAIAATQAARRRRR